MKLNIVSPDGMKDAVIRHLSRNTQLPLSLAEKQIRQFLRQDDGTLAGILLHLGAAASRLDALAHFRHIPTSQVRITFSLRNSRKEMYLLIENIIAFPLIVPAKIRNKAGKIITVSLFIR